MKSYIQKLVLCVALICPFAIAKGSVNLVFAQAPSITVLAGGSFTLTLNIVVTAGEPVTGVDYYLQELSAAGFYIISRDITGSVFPDAFFSNALVTSSADSAAPVGPDNLFNTRNDFDLGADTQFADETTGSGFVATYTIGVPVVGAGTQYTLTTTSNAGTGWVSPSNTNPTDHAFDSHASILITVVPEPATWSLLGLGALGAFGLNLLRARRR